MILPLTVVRVLVPKAMLELGLFSMHTHKCNPRTMIYIVRRRSYMFQLYNYDTAAFAITWWVNG